MGVSIGMLVCPGDSSSPQDLTRSRGRSSHELLEKYEEQQKTAAVANGRDYLKGSGQHTLRVGGVPFMAGDRAKRKKREDDSDDEELLRVRQAKKKDALWSESQLKMAAIESKYCARVVSGNNGSRSD